MKANFSRSMLVLVVVLAVLVVIWLMANPVRATLGNYGTPVRCTAININSGQSAFLDCFAADGTPFTDGQRVPSGYYLLVTDVVVTVSDYGSILKPLTRLSVPI